MKTPIYKWSGNYWGFVYNGRLFDKNANYSGWINDQGRAWSKDGSYLGEIVQENYILRNASRVELVNRAAKVAPVSPIPPIPKINRIGKIGKVG